MNPPIDFCGVALLSHAVNYGRLISGQVSQRLNLFSETPWPHIYAKKTTKNIISFFRLRRRDISLKSLSRWWFEVSQPHRLNLPPKRLNPKPFFRFVVRKVSQPHSSSSLGVSTPGTLALRQKRAFRPLCRVGIRSLTHPLTCSIALGSSVCCALSGGWPRGTIPAP